MQIYIYIYIYTHTGVGYMNTHLDVASVLKVQTPLPQFQSSCKDTRSS